MSDLSEPLPSSKVSRTRIFFRRLRHHITSTHVRDPIVWLRHRSFRPSDVMLASYPRSGSTWLRFVLFEILTGQPSGFDQVNAALRGLADYRKAPALLPGEGRFIGTHEPFRPDYRRAVYLVRDVRDVILSEFAFEKNLGIGRPTLDAYLDEMLRGRKRHGSWQDHVESWLDSPLSASGNLLFLRYEVLRHDSENVFLELLDFLKIRRSRAEVERAIANNTLQRMREKEDQLYKQENYADVPRRPLKSAEAGGRFVRSGSMGGWRDRLTAEQIRRIELHTAHVLTRLGYPVENVPAPEMAPIS